jgi:hypothetical protein
MILLWSKLAQTGGLNASGNPAWLRYDAKTDPYLELAIPPRALAALHKDQCDFWDTVPLPWPHL